LESDYFLLAVLEEDLLQEEYFLIQLVYSTTN
jgi:hypothetical protein